MGQKTHPIGFRIGFNKSWSSNWFDERNYTSKLTEDLKLRRYILKRLPNAGVSGVDILRTSKKITISINTSRPGIVIGRKGEEVDLLRLELQKLTNTDVQVNVNEIKRPELDATLVGNNIAAQLVKKVSFRRAVKKAIQATMRMGAEGIRIQVSGRLGGAEMSRTETYREGRVPLHTLRADIDFASVTAHTTYGCIGVKVWICNGESYKKTS
ncbi:MAG: 30S ribosomal protein S3 [Candidatus Marinimicrobia bacterium]|nr:30S ribosomal protein S3 [Candidatus Neomarinimicrobiota bacterium]RKY61805.1 MAG: 30S ribosomal protein S3 [Candidatus Neomarinimicrobiota bacterium]